MLVTARLARVILVAMAARYGQPTNENGTLVFPAAGVELRRTSSGHWVVCQASAPTTALLDLLRRDLRLALEPPLHDHPPRTPLYDLPATMRHL